MHPPPYCQILPPPLALPDIPGYVSLWLAPGDYAAVAEALQAEFPLPENLKSAVPKRQALYLAGRWCAHRALKAAGLTAPPEIGTGPAGEPLWPPGWRGSITHSHSHVSAAVAPLSTWQGIGLDNETPMAPKTLHAVKERISTPVERLRCPAGLPEALYYTLLFSAKESLFKALYPHVQRFFDFQAAEMEYHAEGGWRLCLKEGLSPTLPQGKCFEVVSQICPDQIYTAVLWQAEFSENRKRTE